MYIKISLLFCALYFFTAVRSVGLREHQINSCVELSERYKIINNVIPRMRTMTHLMDLGYKMLINFFPSIEKKEDWIDWEEQNLTTHEVRIFMGMFTIQDKKGVHDGLLTYAELVSLINNDLTLKPDVKGNIKNEFNNGDLINAQKFLAAILKHKPEGKGLDKKQIQICSSLYKFDYDHLPAASLKDLLLKLQIVSNEYDSLLEFEQFQTAANELKELLVLWSEYNKDVDANSPSITSMEVREYLCDFSMYDRNGDGVLNYWEFEPIAHLYMPEYRAMDVLKKYSDLYFTPEIPEFIPISQSYPDIYIGDYWDGKCTMSAAMFLHLKYFLRFERKRLAPKKPKKKSRFLCCYGH
ncbi:uncharacterized protein LOC126836538 isoform X2 [Adelges cooleyi]|uniref:uncharacterized protein LOC126836538 isoform X2 n=1 Tax=Adelges cooleyi TaxID=133065 RepID=UPI00217F2662|nr:uncharacterized protein LOC126836538 isoform X2 [Adelges cooleyi]